MVRLIRFAAILWIGYLIVLALISQSFPAPQRANLLYYVLLGCIALLCLGLAYWPWIQKRLRQAFVPVIVVVITIMPVIANWLMTRLSPFSPPFPPEGPVLGLLPFLFIALLLVAWQYRWQYILLIILGTTGLNLGVIWSFAEPGTPPFQGGLVITLIQSIIFLAVGFSISYLMSRLRGQQQSLEEANIRLTHYASTLVHLTTSRERNRLAWELHDTLAHTLSGLSVQLETVKAYWDVDQQTARSILEKSLVATHSGLEETRRALKALRASPLDDLGLAMATRNMVEETAARANLTLDLSIMDKVPTLSPDVEQCVYRVAQEAVTNVVKHANAKNLTVKLEFIEGKVTLIVGDDGVGFGIEKSSKTSHFGLTGMRERAQLLGGEFDVISEPGYGTTIQLTI
ncbi:MAG: sensor histidine kinase [Planctomycetes bacterium]|nr:sensor histidine kinase [Planctomycetota bacterium]